jgi:hypothetical protein
MPLSLDQFPVIFILAAVFVLAGLASAMDNTDSHRRVVSKFFVYCVAAAFGGVGGMLVFRGGPVWLSSQTVITEQYAIIAGGLLFTILILVLRRVWNRARTATAPPEQAPRDNGHFPRYPMQP